MSIPVGGDETQILPQNYAFLQDYIYRESGIVLEAEKHYLLDARLMGLASEQGLKSLNDLCALLQATHDNEIRQKVVNAMTTNETYFMREVAHFDALRKTVFPALCEARAGTRQLRFWSAAASTGQEAYSLAMILLEMGLGDWSIEILGTDLCSDVIERAKQGRFSQLEMNRGLPASYLLKYFRRVGLEWEVKEEIRRMTEFQTFDLRADMHSMGPFDVVFCRNVLIYFDVPTKKKIVEGIHGRLFPGGYLILGSTESGLSVTEKLERENIGEATLYKAR